MARMSADALRTYVRSYLEVEVDELDSDLLDVWRDEAINRIARSSSNWKFYDKTWTLTTSEDTQSYDLDVEFSDVDEIVSVRSSQFKLEPIPHGLAEEWFTGTTVTSTTPQYWSIYDDTLYFWPTPASAVEYTLRGKRDPAPVGDDPASEPDLPADFHPLIAEFMLSRAYEKQDDEVMSQQKFARFESELEILRRRYERSTPAGVATIGGAKFRRPEWPAGRLAYDWEN